MAVLPIQRFHLHFLRTKNGRVHSGSENATFGAGQKLSRRRALQSELKYGFFCSGVGRSAADRIARFGDWMDLFHKWQKDIGFDVSPIKNFEFDADHAVDHVNRR